MEPTALSTGAKTKENYRVREITRFKQFKSQMPTLMKIRESPLSFFLSLSSTTALASISVALRYFKKRKKCSAAIYL